MIPLEIGLFLLKEADSVGRQARYYARKGLITCLTNHIRSLEQLQLDGLPSSGSLNLHLILEQCLSALKLIQDKIETNKNPTFEEIQDIANSLEKESLPIDEKTFLSPLFFVNRFLSPLQDAS